MRKPRGGRHVVLGSGARAYPYSHTPGGLNYKVGAPSRAPWNGMSAKHEI